MKLRSNTHRTHMKRTTPLWFIWICAEFYVKQIRISHLLNVHLVQRKLNNMARYSNGINGAFFGKIGPVVGTSRNGVPYMKSKGNPRTAAATPAEQLNRNKFSNAHAWLKPLLPVLRVGYKGYSQTTYGFNAAKSYVLRNTMENGQVLPELVKISIGDLPVSPDISLSVSDDRKLQFSWSPELIANADAKDQLMVLAYLPDKAIAIYEIHGAFRETGMQVLNLVNDFADKIIHVYAAFVAADRSRQSESIYFGPISVV
jgi:hypothetical protein